MRVLTDEDAEMERWRMMHEGIEFWDDVNDWKPLSWEMAVKARKLEMELYKKMGVCKKVPRDVAKKMGCKVNTTKWVDTNKGDTSRPNYRSRLVGHEVKYDKKTRSLFGDSTIGDAEVHVFHVCERSDRARAVSSCRHRHRACILLRACPKTHLHRNSKKRGLGTWRRRMRGPVAVKLV